MIHKILLIHGEFQAKPDDCESSTYTRTTVEPNGGASSGWEGCKIRTDKVGYSL